MKLTGSNHIQEESSKLTLISLAAETALVGDCGPAEQAVRLCELATIGCASNCHEKAYELLSMARKILEPPSVPAAAHQSASITLADALFECHRHDEGSKVCSRIAEVLGCDVSHMATIQEVHLALVYARANRMMSAQHLEARIRRRIEGISIGEISVFLMQHLFRFYVGINAFSRANRLLRDLPGTDNAILFAAFDVLHQPKLIPLVRQRAVWLSNLRPKVPVVALGLLMLWLARVGAREEMQRIWRQVELGIETERERESKMTGTCLAYLAFFEMGRGSPLEALSKYVRNWQAQDCTNLAVLPRIYLARCLAAMGDVRRALELETRNDNVPLEGIRGPIIDQLLKSSRTDVALALIREAEDPIRPSLIFRFGCGAARNLREISAEQLEKYRREVLSLRGTLKSTGSDRE
jgi:hypothetical protein